MADLDKIKRNVGRMVDQNAPPQDIDAYIQGEGVTIEQVRNHKPGQQRSFAPTTPVLSPRDGQQQEEVFQPFESLTSGPGRYVHTFKNALLPGGSKMSSVLAATDDVLRGAPNRHTGQPISFGDAYHYYNKRFNATEDAIEKDFGVLDAPFRSLGWALGGAALKLPEAAVASAQYVPQAQQFLNSVWGSIRPGAAFGASQAGLDSRGQTASEVLTDTLGGLIGGAVVTPAVPLSVNALSRLAGKMGDAYRYMTGRGQDARENVLNRAADWKDAGVREFAPALTDNPLMKATSEGGIGSVFGGSLRQAAERSIEDTTRLAQGAIRRGTNGAPSSDLGQTLQDELRRVLIERSKPGDIIRASPQPDLERITGPVGDTGFMPPRPRVDPVQPRNQQPFRVDPIDPAEVKIDPVRPAHVEPPVPNQKYTRFEDIPTPEHWQQPLAEAQAKFEPISRQFNDLKARFIDTAKTYNVTPEQLMEAAGNPMHPVHNLRLRLAESYDLLRQERAKLDEIRRKVDYDRDLIWTDVLRSEDTAFKKRFADDRMRYEAEVQEAQRVAAAETARLRAEELQRMQAQREAEARGKYAADQIRLRAEAEEATRRAQSAADGQWERDIINQPGLNPGVSRESYPTVFDAAYELAGRKTPGIQRNPLGRKGDPEPTSLLRVLDELGLEGRRQGFAPGYKPGQLFQETGDWAPHVGKYIDELVGPDVARRLDAYATLRKNNQFPPGIQGLRDLRTAIREAAQLAERPPYPGVPRKDAAAALRRIEGALTEDMYRFMGEGGPAGQAATHLWRGTDRAYADYINDLRKPLSKLFGDRVQPIDAMNTIAKAFVDGDLKLANQFMRVMHEKGDPKFAATAVIAHLTNNAATLREFVEGIGKIPLESRKVLFRGQDGQVMLREMAQLERIGQRLMPYANQIDKGVRVFGNRLDLTNPANIALGLAAVANFYPALMMAGGAAFVARFMASPRYLSWMTRGAAIRRPEEWTRHLQTLVRFADTDKDGLGKDILEAVRSLPAGAANAKPRRTQQDTPEPAGQPPASGTPRGPRQGDEIFTSLEEPPSPDEVRAAIKAGQRHFDFDLTQPGGEEAARIIKQLGGTITAYHVGGGGGNLWGGKSQGEQVRRFNKPEELQQLTEDVRSLVEKGADSIHFDNTHRFSFRTLTKIFEAVKAGGAELVAKNNPSGWLKVMKSRPDLVPSYAVLEDIIRDPDETEAAREMSERGVPVYVIGFKKPLERGTPEMTEEEAAAYQKANPWARVLLMEDEKHYDGRTGRFLKPDDKKQPLPGMMRLGGPKPDVPKGFDPITFSRRAVTDEEREAAEKFRTENAGNPIIRADPDGNKLNVPWYEALYQDTGVLPEQGTVKKKPKWMKEIDDSEAVFSSERVPNDRFIPLPEVFKHAELFKLYPGLADIKVRISKKPERDNAEAFYEPDNKALVFNPQVWKEKDVDGKRELFFHELQHVIDDLDGLPFEKLSESLADTTSHRHDMPEAMRRAKPPSQIYDFRPGSYIWKDEHPDLVDGWRTHAVPVEERAVTNRRSKRPPGMMNLGGPDAPRDNQRETGDPFSVVRDAAVKSGIDVRRASPQEIIDAAWKATPTDAVGEMIEMMARKYNLRRPWETGRK